MIRHVAQTTAACCFIAFSALVGAAPLPAAPPDRTSLAIAKMSAYSSRFQEQIQAGKYQEAEETALEYRRYWEEIIEKHNPPRKLANNVMAQVLMMQGHACLRQGRFAQAEQFFTKWFELGQDKFPGHLAVSHYLDHLLTQLLDDDLHSAKRTMSHMRRLVESQLTNEPMAVHELLMAEYHVSIHEGRYMEAESIQQRLYGILEHAEMAAGDIERAEIFKLRAGVRLAERRVYRGQEAEAFELFRQCLAEAEERLGPEHLAVVNCLITFTSCCLESEYYGQAEMLARRTLSILKKTEGIDQIQVAHLMCGLAFVKWRQGDYVESARLHRRALTIAEKHCGKDDPDLASFRCFFAHVLRDQGRYAEAERLYSQASSIWEKELRSEEIGFRTRKVAQSLCDLYLGLGRLHQNEGHLSLSESCYRRAFEVMEASWGPKHPKLWLPLTYLAMLYSDQGRFTMAKETLDRASSNMGEALGGLETLPLRFCWTLTRRAEIAWKSGRRDEALHDLQQAMQVGEELQAHAFGGERERAESLGRFVDAFELMLVYQLELGHTQEALNAVERGRARSLREQMRTQGIDLLAGVPNSVADKLRTRDREAKTRIAGLRKQLEVLNYRRDLSPEEQEKERQSLGGELEQVKLEYASVRADIRNVSPAYRLAVARAGEPVAVSKLQEWVAAQDALLLEYVSGSEGGYLLVIPGDGPARFERVAVSEPQAHVLGVEPGLLTAELAQDVLSPTERRGVLKRLRVPEPDNARGDESVSALAALWEVLIPEPERAAILAGKYKRIIVLPDGPLAQLPFETLVTSGQGDPQYLLDIGPPIQYAPSATILLNLAEREAAGSRLADRAPVLTVGDCQYNLASDVDEESIVADLAPRNRYASLGGQLKPLRFTEKEMRYVAKVFGKREIPVAWLRREMATERIVRHNVSGRRIVHFATHGLVDQSFGNLFGSLALTPGQKSENPADDGYLTLAEIYELNLKGCELAILSACDTNAGPEQRGEGVWALSRGFLVAGARRVVATNWLVNDEAAASLISYFCGGIAQAEAKGEQPDYAKCLHDAKRWIRKQEKWKSPYYWAPFVLVGPN